MKQFTIDDVVYAAQAGCVLEAGVDKPGNVGPGHDFKDTRYEDFILSGIALGRAVRKAVEFGTKYERNMPGLGSLIHLAVDDSIKSHRGRNTNLGMAMLIIPLSASCGTALKNNAFSLKSLRKGVASVISGSTPQDTLDLYTAIVLSDAEVGRSRRFDVKDPESERKVLDNELNLQRVFEISKWDSVAKELVTEMEMTFTVGYPALKTGFEETGDIRASILGCFFEILSRVPDTLIERKNTRKTAVEVSNEAGEILEKGLLPEDVKSFDSKLRRDGNRYNPGTTADLTASSLMVAILDDVLENP